MKVLVLGANGMLGHAVHRTLATSHRYDVLGTVRRLATGQMRETDMNFRAGVDALTFDTVTAAVMEFRPDVVINALGVIKQRSDAADIWNLIQINSAFPKRLEVLCATLGAKLIHFSTDCVFSGARGNYLESDIPDSTDWYGVSKHLGEVGAGRSLTLRTSIIGCGIPPNNSLVDWFLSQRGVVKGYSKAVFSGLPVNEFGRLFAEKLDDGLMEMSGLYHVSADPISKYELLQHVKNEWQRDDLSLQDAPDFVIDRSLNSSRFRSELQYAPAPWPTLIKEMYEFYKD